MRWAFVLALPLVLLATSASSSYRSLREPARTVLDLRLGLVQDFETPGRNFWQGIGQGGIVQLRKGHVTGALLPFPAPGNRSSTPELAVRFARFRSALATTQSFDGRACTPAPGRIATWFELAAPEQLAADPDEVATWVARGIRVFALAGRVDSALATSAIPAGSERVIGLTTVGRRVVEAVMKAGGLVDVANLSDAAIFEVLDVAREHRAPVIVTRGSARAVRRRAGSLSDGQLRAIAEGGGVIGVSFDRELIGDGTDADLTDLLKQLDHLLRVAGEDAVALASGYETGSIPAQAFKSASRYPRLSEALRAHGVSSNQVQKLLHGNAARVLCGAPTGGTK